MRLIAYGDNMRQSVHVYRSGNCTTIGFRPATLSWARHNTGRPLLITYRYSVNFPISRIMNVINVRLQIGDSEKAAGDDGHQLPKTWPTRRYVHSRDDYSYISSAYRISECWRHGESCSWYLLSKVNICILLYPTVWHAHVQGRLRTVAPGCPCPSGFGDRHEAVAWQKGTPVGARVCFTHAQPLGQSVYTIRRVRFEFQVQSLSSRHLLVGANYRSWPISLSAYTPFAYYSRRNSIRPWVIMKQFLSTPVKLTGQRYGCSVGCMEFIHPFGSLCLL